MGYLQEEVVDEMKKVTDQTHAGLYRQVNVLQQMVFLGRGVVGRGQRGLTSPYFFVLGLNDPLFVSIDVSHSRVSIVRVATLTLSRRPTLLFLGHLCF